VIDGQRYTFGVSGLRYKRNLLAYDHQTISRWSQILKQAVTGAMTETGLKTIPLEETSWKDWKTRHPDTLVLSLETGHRRDYFQDPYEWIRGEQVLGIIVEGQAKAYSFKALRRVIKGSQPLQDKIGNHTVFVHYEKDASRVWVTDADGRAVDFLVTYREAWNRFYPDALHYELP